MTMRSVTVVGAGVIGLSAAVRLLDEIPGIKVVLISDEVSPNTTGDGSAGLWGPYLCGSTPAGDIVRWSKETHEFLHSLWSGGLASEVGIALQPMYRLNTITGGEPAPLWADIVYGWQTLGTKEIQALSKEHGVSYTVGHHFVTFTCESTKLLPYLTKRFLAKGGILGTGMKVGHLSEINNCDLIVNCSGLGARELVDDRAVTPIRGQVMRVSAPWMFQVILDNSDDGNYIIPNCETVVLGGTHQEGDYNRNISTADSAFIKDGCSKIYPALKNAPVIREWAGLRPGRFAVRLELDYSGDIPVVHNYGHGGCGVTMSWGCAKDVVNITKNLIANSNALKLNSKL